MSTHNKSAEGDSALPVPSSRLATSEISFPDEDVGPTPKSENGTTLPIQRNEPISGPDNQPTFGKKTEYNTVIADGKVSSNGKLDNGKSLRALSDNADVVKEKPSKKYSLTRDDVQVIDASQEKPLSPSKILLSPTVPEDEVVSKMQFKKTDGSSDKKDPPKGGVSISRAIDTFSVSSAGNNTQSLADTFKNEMDAAMEEEYQMHRLGSKNYKEDTPSPLEMANIIGELQVEEEQENVLDENIEEAIEHGLIPTPKSAIQELPPLPPRLQDEEAGLPTEEDYMNMIEIGKKLQNEVKEPEVILPELAGLPEAVRKSFRVPTPSQTELAKLTPDSVPSQPKQDDVVPKQSGPGDSRQKFEVLNGNTNTGPTPTVDKDKKAVIDHSHRTLGMTRISKSLRSSFCADS
jgi:hypothetical protein